jgi:hypothetical protein
MTPDQFIHNWQNHSLKENFSFKLYCQKQLV